MMDKLQIITDLIMSFAGHVKPKDLLNDMEKVFEIADRLEKAAIKRRLIMPNACQRCGEKVAIMNLSSMTSKSFRMSCGCKDIRGDDMNVLIDKWIAS